jgi:hypothetical protein
MKTLLIITAGLTFIMSSCEKKQTAVPSTSSTVTNTSVQTTSGTEVPVTISGGYETVASDGGRPTILIAAALNVTQAQFQDAFSRVTPARGSEPTTAQELANKAALLATLAPLGVNNDRLDEVSGFYRYLESAGQVWQRTAATATATVINGVVTKITITSAGAGYSSVPIITVPGSSSKIAATLAYGTNLTTNGRISALTVQ